MNRYYCPDLEIGYLSPEESHHCLHVMRHAVGDFFTAFDGRGTEWKVKVKEAGKERVFFSKIAEARSSRRADSVCLGQAITKNKTMDLIVQKATELGVTELAPLQSDRSISLVEDDKAETRRAKWQQLTIEAAKQCGQNWLPAVGLPVKPRDFFSQTSRFQIKLVASLQAEAKPLKEVLREQCAEFPSPRSIALLIGPEGDFTPAEMGEARAAGFLPVSLGPIVLRSETAALYTLGAILYELS